tara:strand:- start:1175 stop:1507 length:333 start_codon:yes stop_codon:yes gene_type:complete
MGYKMKEFSGFKSSALSPIKQTTPGGIAKEVGKRLFTGPIGWASNIALGASLVWDGIKWVSKQKEPPDIPEVYVTTEKFRKHEENRKKQEQKTGTQLKKGDKIKVLGPED